MNKRANKGNSKLFMTSLKIGGNCIMDKQFLNAKIQNSLTHHKRGTFINILGYLKLFNVLEIYSGRGFFYWGYASQ